MKQLLLVIFASFSLLSFAQKGEVERPNTYNYKRAIELYNEDNYSEALEYAQRELNDNPKNGYAYNLEQSIYYRYEEYGKALTASNNAIKYLPKKDEDFMAYAFQIRADIYLELADTAKAYKDYATALKMYPNNGRLLYSRAQLLYEQGRYAESDADYKRLIDIDPGDVVGYIGIGRNANKQEKYDEAIKQFNYVIKISPSYSSGYSFRSDSYIGLKQYDKAADDIVSALGIDGDNKAFANMHIFSGFCTNGNHNKAAH